MVNHLITMPEMSIDDSLEIWILWSRISNAAERSIRMITDLPVDTAVS